MRVLMENRWSETIPCHLLLSIQNSSWSIQSSSVTFALWILLTPFDLIWIEQFEVGLKKGLLSSSSEANKTGKFLEFRVDDETGFPSLNIKIWLALTSIFWTGYFFLMSVKTKSLKRKKSETIYNSILHIKLSSALTHSSQWLHNFAGFDHFLILLFAIPKVYANRQ